MNILIIGYGVITKGIIKNLKNKNNLNIYVFSKHKKGKNFFNNINDINLKFEYIISCFKNDTEGLEFIKSTKTNNIFKNSVVIDLTTSSIDGVIKKKNCIQAKKGLYIESPFTGSKEGSEKGELILFVYVPKHFKKELDLYKFLNNFSKKIFQFTEFQSPTKFKLLYNLWGAYILYSLKLFNPLNFDFNFKDTDTCLNIVKNFGWMSLVANSKIDLINESNFNDIHFKMEYMIKDINYSMNYYKILKNNNIVNEICLEYLSKQNKQEKDFTIIAELSDNIKNKFKINRVLNEIKKINKSLNMKKHSIIVTGSISRNDFRYNENEIESDFDVLIIVKDINQIKIIKNKILNQKIKYNEKISFIFTLYEKFINNIDKSYVQSINVKYIIYDGLNLQNILKENTKNKINVESVLQEICYYYAKYLYKHEEFLLNKISLKLKILGLDFKKGEVIHNIINFKKFLNKNNNKLESINFFKENILEIISEYDKNNIKKLKCFYYKMRENVFLENQGLSFKDSFFTIKGDDYNNS